MRNRTLHGPVTEVGAFASKKRLHLLLLGLTTHSHVILRLSTVVAAASCVKDTSDNERHAQFSDVAGVLPQAGWGWEHKKRDPPGSTIEGAVDWAGKCRF